MGMPSSPRPTKPPCTTTTHEDINNVLREIIKEVNKPRNKIIMKEEEKKPQSGVSAVFGLISLGIAIYILWVLISS